MRNLIFSLFLFSAVANGAEIVIRGVGGVGVDSTKVLKTGDTMSGQLNGTSASFSGSLTASSVTVTGVGSVSARINSQSTSGARDAQLILNVANDGAGDPAGTITFSASEFPQADLYSKTESGTTNGTLVMRTRRGGTLTEAFRVNSAGNVGINTTSPGSKLHVVGDATISTSLTVASATVTGNAFSVGGSTFVVTNGRIGIGTTAPLQPLHVALARTGNDGLVNFENTSPAGSGVISLFSLLRGGIHVADFFYQDATSVFGDGTTQTGLISRVANVPMTFMVGGHTAEKMRITSSGNVGIGTTAPLSTLSVTGPTRPGVYTLAQMNALAPGEAGSMITISDAAVPYQYCVSTGTAAGAWTQMNSVTHCQ